MQNLIIDKHSLLNWFVIGLCTTDMVLNKHIYATFVEKKEYISANLNLVSPQLKC